MLCFDLYVIDNRLQGDKLASGALFAVLLNFKHIYMYLAVRHTLKTNLLVNASFPQASILRLPSTFVLYLSYWSGTNQELLIIGKRGHSGLRSFLRALCLNGTNFPVVLSTISIYSWTQSCILGSELLGTNDCC